MDTALWEVFWISPSLSLTFKHFLTPRTCSRAYWMVKHNSRDYARSHPSCLLLLQDTSSSAVVPSRSIPFPFRARREIASGFFFLGGGAACVLTGLYGTASQQLFICYGDGALGKPFSKQRPTHWLCKGISHACELADLDPLEPSERTPPSFGGFVQ